MKRFCGIFMILVVVISLCGCARTSVENNADVTLTFHYEEENISVTLEANEAERVTSILNGNRYDPLFYGIASCGFDKDISMNVGNRIFAIARDGCNCIQYQGNQRYFEITAEDMEYIHSLFEKYGGYFPCV